MSPCAILVSQSRLKCDAIHDDGMIAHRDDVEVGNVVDLDKVEPSMLADALNGLAAGVFFVDASCRVVHANMSGRAMLAKGDPLRVAGTRLSANDVLAERLLRDAFTAVGSGDAVAAKRIALPLSAEAGQGFVAHILPLTRGTRQAGCRYTAAAAIFVQKVTVCEAVPFEAIAKCFKLTPAELRVLLAVVQVGGVPEVASALRIAETTVKTHLQHLFEKTGTNRQADLLKFVAGFMSPLAEPLVPIFLRR